MKHNFKLILQHLPWLLLLFGLDAFAALLLWLADAQSFYSMMIVIILATILLFAAVCRLLVRREQKKEQAFFAFLNNPDAYHEELLLKSAGPSQQESIRLLCQTLQDKQAAYARLQMQLTDYEEYVEAWAHETKTPLSLLTFLLDNRREELSATVGFRLDYVRNRIQESVNQMLFYARLKGGRKDYLFEHIDIRQCIEDVLEDYKPLLEEKQFQIQFHLPDASVYSDRRGLYFLLSQIVSNSIKYCGREPELCFTSFQRDNRYVLSVRDNGPGVRGCDLPYIFEKGFTGGSGDGRKKATGMGLYLAKEIARELKIELYAASKWGEGVEMRAEFPEILE